MYCHLIWYKHSCPPWLCLMSASAVLCEFSMITPLTKMVIIVSIRSETLRQDADEFSPSHTHIHKQDWQQTKRHSHTAMGRDRAQHATCGWLNEGHSQQWLADEQSQSTGICFFKAFSYVCAKMSYHWLVCGTQCPVWLQDTCVAGRGNDNKLDLWHTVSVGPWGEDPACSLTFQKW